MRRSFLVFLITLFAATALSLAIYRFFKLTLTLPLVIFGAALFLSQRQMKNEICRLMCINSGIFLSAMGIIFTAFNLNMIVNDGKTSVKSEGEYVTNGQWIKGDEAQGLGYAYPPNLNNHSSRRVAYHQDNSKEIVYDVIYNIDSLSNRFTPYNKSGIADQTNSILFLGDSLTFGEGLNDNETLPFFVQLQTDRSALNAGMHGYGAHQALRILEDQDLYNKRTKDHTIKTIVYRAIVKHINRTAGYSTWDSVGPCYEIDVLNSVSYKGSFEKCGKKKSSLSKLFEKLASSSEPFTNQIFQRFTNHVNYTNVNYHKADVDRIVAVVAKMSSIAKSKVVNFVVVLEDAETGNELCGTKVPFAQELANQLEQQGINLVLTSNVYTKKVCAANELAIEYDGHPTMVANKLLSDYLIRNKLIY